MLIDPVRSSSEALETRRDASTDRPPNVEDLRRCAWELGARRAQDSYCPDESYVSLASVTPVRGFAAWNLDEAWIEETARRKGQAWHGCVMVLRLYDVSFIIFDGLNAHQLRDLPLASTSGHCTFRLGHAGTCQLAEVGFRLRDGEFIPAARSTVVQFPPDAISTRCDPSALHVDDRLRLHPVSSPWEGEAFVRERRRPRLRPRLRIGLLSFESLATGQDTVVARFASELASGLAAQGQEVHLLVPAGGELDRDRSLAGVHHHPLAVEPGGTPLERAQSFARAAEARLRELPRCDLLHHHEWMTAAVPWLGTRPTVLSLTSIERTRWSGSEAPGPLAQEIEERERAAARAASCILTPRWLRPRLIDGLGVDPSRVHGCPLDGRVSRDWDLPLDLAQVRSELELEPGERMALFVGPLERAAGIDLLFEALPALLAREPGLRLALVGAGGLAHELVSLARRLNVSRAIRWLGHVDSSKLSRLLRASEALVLPARQRIIHDESLVGLARRAGVPVITTHAGPAHLVRHAETGLLAYCEAPSLVWALEQLLGDDDQARRLGEAGAQPAEGRLDWRAVAAAYADLCAFTFAELVA